MKLIQMKSVRHEDKGLKKFVFSNVLVRETLKNENK